MQIKCFLSQYNSRFWLNQYKIQYYLQLYLNDGVVEYKKDVIAWYCPKIPLSYSPKGYVGLLGLLLELQENNVLFVAYKIILN